MNKCPMIYGFWDRVDEAIAKSGKSKEQIARLMGCERKVLYARGGAMHSTYVARFCVATGISADYLLGLTEG